MFYNINNMNQNGSVFNNNTTFEKNNQNTNTIVRMNNKTRKDIKIGLINLQKKTKEWRTLGNNQKLNSPYDLLRKDFAKLDNYSNKITVLKETRLNEDNNLLTLKNYLLAYHVTYDHAFTLMNQYEIYLTPKSGNNKSELQKLEIIINNTSQKYANNTQSFKDRFIKLNGLLFDSYNSFKTSFEGHTTYFEKEFNVALVTLKDYYIKLIQNFEKEVQNFNLSAANILKKLLELVKTIEKNPTNLETIQTKYQNLFNQNNTRSLNSLFNNLSKTTAEKILNDKKTIISTRHLLSTSLQVGNKEIKLENIGVNLKELPSSMPIQGINNNIQTVLNFYNDKLGARITEINNLLDQYKALCEKLKASIDIAKKSKGETSDLKQIKRIENQVDAIMTQYTQLNMIGNNCKNLGRNILNLKGNTPQGNRNQRNTTKEMSQEIPIERQRPNSINININNVYLKDKNGVDKIDMKTVKFKAQFIYDYLLNKKDRLHNLHIFEPAKRGQFNNKKALITNNDKVTDVYKLDRLIDKIKTIQNPREKQSETSQVPVNKIGYENLINPYNLDFNKRMEYAFNNKDWLVKYLEDKLNNQ